MPRDPATIVLTRWASTGQRSTPAELNIPVSEGFDEEFSERGGEYPPRRLFNQRWYAEDSLVLELNKGVMEWAATIAYVQHDWVKGSDGRAYACKLANTGNDPVAQGSETYWQPLINTPDGTLQAPTPLSATQTRQGVIEIATNAETRAGIESLKAVSPAGLHSRTATQISTGLISLATVSETQAGTVSDKAVAPSALVALTATDARRGLAERANAPETRLGADDERFVSPKGQKDYVDARFVVLTQAQYDALASKAADTFYFIPE